VLSNVVTGGYHVVAALDREGPAPAAGQFYMLAAARWGSSSGRPYLPRACSVAAHDSGAAGVKLEFLLEGVGPGTERLAELDPGEGLCLTGPFGRPFSFPSELAPVSAGAVLVGGGIGIAPLALLRRELAGRGVAQRVLLGFRDRLHAGGLELFDCSEVRLASEDGHAGHHGYVTDLLAVLLEGDDPGGACVYACGPPGMLEAVRRLTTEHGVPAQLALEAPMGCGFGSCFGCAVPVRSGGFMRLCVDGPVVDAAEIESALIAGGGH
jgi:dihydroorotate dehydrogenase electron transfer subunit